MHYDCQSGSWEYSKPRARNTDGLLDALYISALNDQTVEVREDMFGDFGVPRILAGSPPWQHPGVVDCLPSVFSVPKLVQQIFELLTASSLFLNDGFRVL